MKLDFTWVSGRQRLAPRGDPQWRIHGVAATGKRIEIRIWILESCRRENSR